MSIEESIADMQRVAREWPDGVHTCAELQRLEPGRRPCTCGRCRTGLSRYEQLAAMHGVVLCLWCQDRHFRPYPEQAASSCNQIRCQCWCTRGTGQ